jgi:hypothetical protein
MSWNLVTSLMPLASERTPQTYRFAIAIGAVPPLIAVLLGWLPVAMAAAAVLVPAVYLVYLDDVNEWEDEPAPVLLGTVVAAIVLAFVATWLWQTQALGDQRVVQARSGGWSVGTFVVLCLLAPIVGELLRELGPVVLARRPAFDDLIDAVTFAVASGATWAAVETLVLNRNLLLHAPGDLASVDAGHWWVLLITAGLVKPVVYGSASALALAAFSGIGPGYAGFSARYALGFAEAVAYGIAFQIGQYAGDHVGGTVGAVVALLTGAVVLATVVLRVRVVLHAALMESALEAAVVGAEGRHAAQGEAYCGNCDMPLLPAAAFCSACGTATRAVAKPRRSFNGDAGRVLVSATEAAR